MENEKVRINVLLGKELIDRIDKYASEMCISRTAAISVLCAQALDYQESLKLLSQFNILSTLGQPFEK